MAWRRSRGTGGFARAPKMWFHFQELFGLLPRGWAGCQQPGWRKDPLISTRKVKNILCCGCSRRMLRGCGAPVGGSGVPRAPCSACPWGTAPSLLLGTLTKYLQPRFLPCCDF